MDCFILLNLLPDDGLINNTKIGVVSSKKNLITAVLLNSNKTLFITKISSTTTLSKKTVTGDTQPVSSASAILENATVIAETHSKRCDIGLQKNPFAPEQLYLGITRIECWTHFSALINENQLDAKSEITTSNIIHIITAKRFRILEVFFKTALTAWRLFNSVILDGTFIWSLWSKRKNSPAPKVNDIVQAVIRNKRSRWYREVSPPTGD